MLRVFWFYDPGYLHVNSHVFHLRFTRLVFALGLSPAILGSTNWQHLDTQISEEFREELVEQLNNSLYMDDLVTGKESKAKTLDLYSKSKSIMKRGRFNLWKWTLIQDFYKMRLIDQITALYHQLLTKAWRPSLKKTSLTQRPRQDHLSTTEDPPTTALSRYWAQFGTLQMISSRSICQILPMKRSCSQPQNDCCWRSQLKYSIFLDCWAHLLFSGRFYFKHSAMNTLTGMSS